LQTTVVDTTSSPHARLRPVAVRAVRLDDPVWAPRQRTNREVTILTQHDRNEETGRIDNFRRAAGKINGPFQGKYFNDSDVYKWVEAVAWILAAAPGSAGSGGASGTASDLEPLVDGVIEEIAAAQEPDGYLNTYFTFERADERWTNIDLHELYCAGHLIQAAVAHYRATGSRRLLEVAIRFADYICDTFGPEDQGKRATSDGHEEIEMALVELYRTTGDQRYLDQAQFFVDVRGHGRLGRPYDRFGPAYHQDHVPLREMDTFVGHAVRAVYFACGGADLYAETGDDALLGAMHRLWEDLTARKLYVSGGLGSRYDGEAFGAAYELPNSRAYTETCAAIASVMWNWRLFLIEGEARYLDLMEHTLYNAVLPGVSLEGDTYFYQNPLADDGGHRRQPWFGTACCPPNISRTLASLPGYVYATDETGVWVSLYAAGQARIALADGREVAIEQRTNYPWDGEIALAVEPADGPAEFAIHLRVPAWAGEGATLTVNDQPVDEPVTPGTFVTVNRAWVAGDVIRLSLPMPVRRITAHPYATEDTGRVALMRGPILYCLEAVDHPDVDIRDLVLPPDAAITPESRSDLLGGVVALAINGQVAPPGSGWQGTMYRPIGEITPSPMTPATFTAIPYAVWANREPGAMQVWLRTEA
jgi:DUF1680 family protein